MLLTVRLSYLSERDLWSEVLTTRPFVLGFTNGVANGVVINSIAQVHLDIFKVNLKMPEITRVNAMATDVDLDGAKVRYKAVYEVV